MGPRHEAEDDTGILTVPVPVRLAASSPPPSSRRRSGHAATHGACDVDGRSSMRQRRRPAREHRTGGCMSIVPAVAPRAHPHDAGMTESRWGHGPTAAWNSYDLNCSNHSHSAKGRGERMPLSKLCNSIGTGKAPTAARPVRARGCAKNSAGRGPASCPAVAPHPQTLLAVTASPCAAADRPASGLGGSRSAPGADRRCRSCRPWRSPGRASPCRRA